MILIAAADRNWGIGKDNELLTHIPADQKFFRETTTGNVVVMGRKTLESFPKGEPLKNRTNIVLSRNTSYEKAGVTVFHDVDSLLHEIDKYPKDSVFCIGGASIYKELLPYCDKALITRIDEAYEADTFFPNLDEMPEWEIVETSEEQTYFDQIYHFVTYIRK
ncbi:MAG: dihydrofolate reductase [Lachnospiraceae bacterium]|nr:dihydrofolate reductase [Lachnospiraceae bacterium]